MVANGKLIVNSASDFSYNAYLRNRGTGTNATLLEFEKQGSGTQALIGDRISHGGTTTISGGTLLLQGVTAWSSDIVNNSLLILDENVTRTHSRDITGTGGLVKQGGSALTFAGGLNLTYQGATTVRGGTMTVGSPINGTTSLNLLNSGTVLALTGGISNASAITNIVAEHGTTLGLLDGTGNKLSGLTNLQLGSHGGTMTSLNLNVGDGGTAGDELNTDLFTLLTGGTLSLFTGNQITFNITDTGLNPSQTYDLVSVADGGLTTTGLTLGDWLLGAVPGGFTSITLNVTDTLIQLQTGTLITGDLFWRGSAGGGTNDTWNANPDNWSLDKGNTSVASSIPGQGTDVVFAIDSASGAVSTTLEQNFKVNSVTFEAGTSTPSSVTIAPGAIAANRLEVAPQLATDGLLVSAGGPASVTISAPLRIGANQTWSVVDGSSTLTISGALQGEADVTKSGAGKVVLSAPADPTFNTGLTTDVTISAGSLEMTNAGALGSAANSNLANVIINGGAFYYNNATAGTVVNNLTLGGGTLSAGGTAQTYGGSVNISSASTINMADLNGPVTNTARNITLSGLVSGTGSLTINSNNTASAGNQLGGTLTINNALSTWTGDLIFNRGTVTITAAASPTVTPGNLTFNSFGRYILQGLDGQTINRSGTLILAAGAVGEFQVDNTAATPATDFTVNQNGVVTLGSGGTGATLRVSLPDTQARLNLAGGITLGGNSSISASNNAARLLVISGVINDGGNGYNLAINDDAGAWAQTNGTVRLTGLNTFSGNLALGEGILEFDTVTNSGGGASSLGNGPAISIGGGNLNFIGTASQSTDRTISTSASSTLSANGTGGATITYNGAITQVANNVLTLTGAGEGLIKGGITQAAGTGDLSVTAGTWTVQDSNATVGDDLLMTGGNLTLQNMVFTLNDDVVVTSGTLNLNSTGVLVATNPAGTSSGLHVRNGGTINLNANDVWTVAGGIDFINVADTTAGAIATLDTNTFNLTSPGLLVGNIAAGLEGQVIGTGTITVTSTATDHSLGIRTYRGSISANLAGVASLLKQGLGEVTLSGDNSGLTGTVAATRLDAGSLVLDFTTQNNQKISAAAALDMRGSSLTLNGNNTAASSQAVASFTLANGSGANRIVLNAGTGQELLLNLGAITRAVNSQDGTLRIVLPTGTQGAANGVTTSTALTNGVVGSSAFLTVEDASGTWFATKSGNNIVGLASTAKNDVSTWLAGDHITDETTGFTGTFSSVGINSLRFNAAGGSSVDLGGGGVLGIATGGLLITSNVGGTPSLLNGTVFSGAQASNVPELIITHDGATVFELGADLRTNSALTKSGTGTVLLSGNNVSTGAVDIQNGVLQVGGGNGIGDTASVVLSDDKATTLQLLANETIGLLSGGNATSGITVGTVALGTNNLSINATASSTFAGVFTGSGSIIRNGTSGVGNTLLTGVSGSGFTGALVVNGGLMYVEGAATMDASSLTINKGASFLISNNGTTRSGTRFLDTMPVTLNSADGAWNGETRPSGLAIRTDQNATTNESVGVLTFASGASYFRGDAGGTTGVAGLIASNFVRQNSATLNARGRNLGLNSGDRNFLRIASGTANETAFAATLVGGGGAAGTKNISIVPWAIGQTQNANVGDATMGNSLLTYVVATGSGSGFRPLDLATEYNTFATKAANTDNIRESLLADLTGIAGQTINSLVVDNANTAAGTVNVTGTGAGQTLAVTSGTMLFTATGAVTGTPAMGINLGGFDGGITVGGTNEYVVFVQNPTSAAAGGAVTATITSNLTSAADITKSGRGALVLSGTNTAGGGARKTTLNEGILEITGLANIGGNSGALVFAGGTLRVGAGFTDDLSQRAISFLNGGGTLDTNGIDLTLAGSLGAGVGGFTKAGAGNLTLNGTATYTGNSVLSVGTLTIGPTTPSATEAISPWPVEPRWHSE